MRHGVVERLEAPHKVHGEAMPLAVGWPTAAAAAAAATTAAAARRAREGQVRQLGANMDTLVPGPGVGVEAARGEQLDPRVKRLRLGWRGGVEPRRDGAVVWVAHDGEGKPRRKRMGAHARFRRRRDGAQTRSVDPGGRLGAQASVRVELGRVCATQLEALVVAANGQVHALHVA